MKICLTLISSNNNAVLPCSYQYPLSAAIYKIISQADDAYASFLHSTGYKKENSLKTFKLFTFSDINTPFKIEGDRINLKTNQAKLTVCFHIPEAAMNFIKGLFINQKIDIADKKSRATFTISQVEVKPLWESSVKTNGLQEVTLIPASPMVIRISSDEGKYTFLYPDDERFVPALLYHWKEKYSVACGNEAAENDFKNISVTIVGAEKAKSRLITVKAGEPEETQVRGFKGFQLHVKAKTEVIELALNAGIGAFGSMGFGCVDRI
jgi:CRISPR-associated endoribonuclease Cas6